MAAWRERLGAVDAQTATLGLALALAVVTAVRTPEVYGDGVDPRASLRFPRWTTVGVHELFVRSAAPAAAEPGLPRAPRVEAVTGSQKAPERALPRETMKTAPLPPPEPAADPADATPKTWGADPWGGAPAPAPAPAAPPPPAPTKSADPWSSEKAERLGD